MRKVGVVSRGLGGMQRRILAVLYAAKPGQPLLSWLPGLQEWARRAMDLDTSVESAPTTLTTLVHELSYHDVLDRIRRPDEPGCRARRRYEYSNFSRAVRNLGARGFVATR